MYCKIFNSYGWAERDRKTDGCCSKWSALKSWHVPGHTQVPGFTQVFCRIAMKTASTDESQLMNDKVIKRLPKVILSMNDLFK